MKRHWILSTAIALIGCSCSQQDTNSHLKAIDILLTGYLRVDDFRFTFIKHRLYHLIKLICFLFFSFLQNGMEGKSPISFIFNMAQQGKTSISKVIFSLHLYILYSGTDNQDVTHVENFKKACREVVFPTLLRCFGDIWGVLGPYFFLNQSIF